jgi:hypothetical protein
MRSITISSSNGIVDSMKVRVVPQPPPPPPHRLGRRRGGGGWGAGWYQCAVAFAAVVALGWMDDEAGSLSLYATGPTRAITSKGPKNLKANF